MSKFYNTHFSQTTHNPTNYTALTCKGLIGFPTRCCMKYPVTQGTQNTVTIAKEIPVHYSFFPLWLSAWLFKASTRGNKDLASSSPNQYTNSLESHTFKKKSVVYMLRKKKYVHFGTSVALCMALRCPMLYSFVTELLAVKL